MANGALTYLNVSYSLPAMSTVFPNRSLYIQELSTMNSTTSLLFDRCGKRIPPDTSDSNPQIPYTKDQKRDAHMFLFVCYPILLVCCTVGNILNLIVLLREKRKSSTTCYMIAVAVTDIFVLWFFMPDYLNNFGSVYPTYYDYRAHKAEVYTFRGVQVWTMECAIQICDWVLLAFSLERLIAIVRPFSFKWLQTSTAAKCIIAILCVIAAVFKVHDIVYWYWILPALRKNRYNLSTLPEDATPCWLKEWTTLQSSAEVANTIIKFFALLVMNAMVIAAIRRQQKSDLGKQRAVQEKKSAKRYRNTNIILLASAGLYLVSQFPSLVLGCLAVANDNGTYKMSVLTQLYATPICNVFLLCNYSLNFFLYLAVSTKYQKSFARTFFPKYVRSKWKNHKEEKRRRSTVPNVEVTTPKQNVPVVKAVSNGSTLTTLVNSGSVRTPASSETATVLIEPAQNGAAPDGSVMTPSAESTAPLKEATDARAERDESSDSSSLDSSDEEDKASVKMEPVSNGRDHVHSKA